MTRYSRMAADGVNFLIPDSNHILYPTLTDSSIDIPCSQCLWILWRPMSKITVPSKPEAQAGRLSSTDAR